MKTVNKITLTVGKHTQVLDFLKSGFCQDVTINDIDEGFVKANPGDGTSLIIKALIALRAYALVRSPHRFAADISSPLPAGNKAWPHQDVTLTVSDNRFLYTVEFSPSFAELTETAVIYDTTMRTPSVIYEVFTHIEDFSNNAFSDNAKSTFAPPLPSIVTSFFNNMVLFTDAYNRSAPDYSWAQREDLLVNTISAVDRLLAYNHQNFTCTLEESIDKAVEELTGSPLVWKVVTGAHLGWKGVSDAHFGFNMSHIGRLVADGDSDAVIALDQLMYTFQCLLITAYNAASCVITDRIPFVNKDTGERIFKLINLLQIGCSYNNIKALVRGDVAKTMVELA